MEVAIIIPTKNEEKNLPHLLHSIKSQTFKDFQIIVADADSKDKTKAIAKKNGCIVIKGGMPPVARNNGAKKAIALGTKTLIFIDADVILPSRTFIEKSIEEFKRRRLDVAGVPIHPYEIRNGKFVTSKDKKLIRYYQFINWILKRSQNGKKPFMQQYMVVKKDVHIKLNGFKELEFGEDSDYSKRAARGGYKFGVLETPGKLLISPRRFDEKGFLRLFTLYAYLNIRIFLGHEFPLNEKRVYFEK